MNKANRDLAIVAGAVLFVSAVLPLVGSVVDIVQSAINAKINRMQLALNLDQCEHEAAAEVIRPHSKQTNAIGFSVDDEPDFDEMEDDE